MIEDQRPVIDGHGPLLGDVAVGQEEQLASRITRGERAFGLNDFPQLSVIALHRVGGVDQPPDFTRIVENRFLVCECLNS